MKTVATINLTLSVEFEDNGVDDLKDQARDALFLYGADPDTAEIEKIWIEDDGDHTHD